MMKKKLSLVLLALLLVFSCVPTASAITYPTAWVPNSQWNVATSDLFLKSTKQAFGAAVTALVATKASNAYAVGIAAAGGFGTYYFVNSSNERVYYYHSYRYREYGPPTYDDMGNAIPKFEIEKTQRTSKNSDWTGGQVTVTIEKSSIVTPWF